MDTGQRLGFCFCVCLGACLSNIVLRLVVLVKTNDKRCESPLFLHVEVMFGSMCFRPAEIHEPPGLVRGCARPPGRDWYIPSAGPPGLAHVVRCSRSTVHDTPTFNTLNSSMFPPPKVLQIYFLLPMRYRGTFQNL